LTSKRTTVPGSAGKSDGRSTLVGLDVCGLVTVDVAVVACIVPPKRTIRWTGSLELERCLTFFFVF
jgi:hypothetical protein